MLRIVFGKDDQNKSNRSSLKNGQNVIESIEQGLTNRSRPSKKN